MDAKSVIAFAVQLSLILIVFVVGLRGRWSELVYVFQRPALLLRSILAVNILVPLVAIIFCLSLPAALPTEAGIILMALSPMAPFAPGKMFKTGSSENYVVGTYVALILVAVVLVPTSTAVITAVFGHDVYVPIWQVAELVGTSVLLPLLAGIALGTTWPKLSERGMPILTIVAYGILVPIALLFLYKSGGAMLALIGDGTLAIIVGTILIGLAAGHILGGPEPQHRMALAQAAVTRHPGLAGLIAHRHFDNPKVMLAVVLFLLVGIVVSGFYGKWASTRLRPVRQAAPAE